VRRGAPFGGGRRVGRAFVREVLGLILASRGNKTSVCAWIAVWESHATPFVDGKLRNLDTGTGRGIKTSGPSVADLHREQQSRRRVLSLGLNS
jgi:hypothetical protein